MREGLYNDCKKGAFAVKKRKRVICGIAALILMGLTVWRLWPRRIDSLMNGSGREADRFYASIDMATAEDGFPARRTYKLEGGPEEGHRVLEILRKGRYQASFRELLPWVRASGTKTGMGKLVVLYFFYDKSEPEDDFIFFYSGFQRGDSGYVNGRTVYAVGNDVFDELTEYIMSQGQPNDP